MSNLILASSSPRRIELLKQINLKFNICPSEIDENKFIDNQTRPEFIAMNIATEKVNDVKTKIKGVILGADTIVVLNSEIFGKPQNKNEAIEFITKLNNQTHKVITGVSIYDTTKKYGQNFYEITEVTFNNLSHDQIQNYIKTKEYEGKSGAYAIQGIGSLLVKEIKGCYFNVVGLPLSKLAIILKNFNLNTI